jgi:hypothetical protein
VLLRYDSSLDVFIDIYLEYHRYYLRNGLCAGVNDYSDIVPLLRLTNSSDHFYVSGDKKWVNDIVNGVYPGKALNIDTILNQ